MVRACVFPGQGSQFVGMGKELAEADSAARDVFAEVDDALSQNLFRLMVEGPEEDLKLTENTQPALMATSMAIMRVLEKSGVHMSHMAAFVAGHSLGEYTALAAAGSLDLATTARLLKRRGQAMQKAVPVGEGAMAAILGLELGIVEEVCETVQGRGVCVAANDNAPGQVVISGHRDAVAAAIDALKERGTKRAMMLPVSAPFHCPLMQPAAEEMKAALDAVALKAPVVPVITNVTAAPESEPERLKALLVEQVTARVRWRESVAAMPSHNVDTVVEIGAGKVLSGMTRRIDRALTPVSVQTPDDIDAFIAGL
ncbi:ACP S-malonyltransferase [Yunchengibacter salinarum]|uniref:ACP S-malonyltransferase n=1 Tax=Yunchengibacter salinarum TaxID=3133399 RepID=UPI0035B66CCA